MNERSTESRLAELEERIDSQERFADFLHSEITQLWAANARPSTSLAVLDGNDDKIDALLAGMDTLLECVQGHASLSRAAAADQAAAIAYDETHDEQPKRMPETEREQTAESKTAPSQGYRVDPEVYSAKVGENEAALKASLANTPAVSGEEPAPLPVVQVHEPAIDQPAPQPQTPRANLAESLQSVKTVEAGIAWADQLASLVPANAADPACVRACAEAAVAFLVASMPPYMNKVPNFANVLQAEVDTLGPSISTCPQAASPWATFIEADPATQAASRKALAAAFDKEVRNAAL